MRPAVTRWPSIMGCAALFLARRAARASVSGRAARIVRRGEARFPGRDGLRDFQNDLAVRRRC